MKHKPRNTTERHAIRAALLAGCEYRTYGPQGMQAYRVLREHPDGSFDLEPVQGAPAEVTP